MTHDQFVYKYNGKFIDFDGYYGPQCVDLMRKYLQECLKVDPYSLPRANYAKNIYKNFVGSSTWRKVKNTPTGVPKKGDIIFWDWYWPVTGVAGHVAIFDSGDVNNLITFDQNYPKNSPCKFVKHSYRGVMGWLRPRK